MGKYKVQVYSMLHPVENRLVFSGAILELEKETALPYVGSGYLYPEQEEQIGESISEKRICIADGVVGVELDVTFPTEGTTDAPSELFAAMTETVVEKEIVPITGKEKKK